MQHRFIAEVQRLSGRRVLDFISSHHVGPDLEIELFFLADATYGLCDGRIPPLTRSIRAPCSEPAARGSQRTKRD